MSPRRIPRGPDDPSILKLEREARIKEKIHRVRQDAYRERSAGRILECERLLGIANQLAQRDLLRKPRPKPPVQVSLFEEEK